jgi:hypothetical protein
MLRRSCVSRSILGGNSRSLHKREGITWDRPRLELNSVSEIRRHQPHSAPGGEVKSGALALEIMRRL